MPIDFAQLLKEEKQNSLLFSKRATERILGLAPFSIDDQKINTKTVVVKVARQKNLVEIPRQRYLEDFVSFRISGAKDIHIAKISSNNNDFRYRATNQTNKHTYALELTTTGIQCECEDYQNQHEISAKACCKHGYALLNHLGFDKLQDYLDYQIQHAA